MGYRDDTYIDAYDLGTKMMTKSMRMRFVDAVGDFFFHLP
jgi:hypothetical protein